ncbi:MAG: ASCH domain-containing protein [Gemmatimonadaceae bacterium]
MKALTLTQPWATLVAIGAKTIETRSWPTHYRGEVAIHAAKGFPDWARQIVDGEPESLMVSYTERPSDCHYVKIVCEGVRGFYSLRPSPVDGTLCLRWVQRAPTGRVEGRADG